MYLKSKKNIQDGSVCLGHYPWQVHFSWEPFLPHKKNRLRIRARLVNKFLGGGGRSSEEEESSRPKGPTHTERLAKLTRTRSLSAPPVYRGPSRREVAGQAGVPKDPPLPLDVPLRQGRASARPMSSRRRRREARRRRPACI